MLAYINIYKMKEDYNNKLIIWELYNTHTEKILAFSSEFKMFLKIERHFWG